MVAGAPNVDYPAADTALSVMQIGQDEARTSRVRRASEPYLHITPPRDATGNSITLVERDVLELSWQADDGLRSVPADAVSISDEGLWKVKVTGSASRIQRRDADRKST